MKRGSAHIRKKSGRPVAGFAPKAPVGFPHGWPQRTRDTYRLLTWAEEIRVSHHRWKLAAVVEKLREDHAVWAKNAGLHIDRRRLSDYARRLPIDGNVDRRGKHGVHRSEAKPIAEAMLGLLWHAVMFMRLPVRTAYRAVQATARKLRAPFPSLRTLQRRYRFLTDARKLVYQRARVWKAVRR